MRKNEFTCNPQAKIQIAKSNALLNAQPLWSFFCLLPFLFIQLFLREIHNGCENDGLVHGIIASNAPQICGTRNNKNKKTNIFSSQRDGHCRR